MTAYRTFIAFEVITQAKPDQALLESLPQATLGRRYGGGNAIARVILSRVQEVDVEELEEVDADSVSEVAAA